MVKVAVCKFLMLQKKVKNTFFFSFFGIKMFKIERL